MKNLVLLFIVMLFIQFTLPAQSGWVEQTSGTTENVNSVFFINESVGWAVGENGLIISTTDGGVSWESQNSNTTDDLFSVKFIDENVGWVIKGDIDGIWGGPVSGILKTSTGGANWDSLNTPGAPYFLSDDIGWAFESGVYWPDVYCKTTDGGISWDTIYTATGFYTSLIYFVNENFGLVSQYLGEFGGVSFKFLRTLDGGHNWDNIVGQKRVISLFFVNDSVGWGSFTGTDVSLGGWLKKTEDGGENWDEQLSIHSGYRYFGDVYFINEDKGWITGGGKPDSIMFTTNGGENWNTQSIGDSADLNSIYFIDENVSCMVGENGKILYTTTGGVVSVEENQINDIPTEYSLSQNYPNPFNPSTKISWQLPVGSWQTLRLYDVLGNEIATLVNEYKPVGKYEIEFDATALPSGVYFYQLKAGEFIKTKKMILIK